MFSVAATIAWTSHGAPRRAAPSRAPSTAAAPPLSTPTPLHAPGDGAEPAPGGRGRAAPWGALSPAAAPPMSIFMPIIASLGLIDRPPESKVTPLPTRHTRPLLSPRGGDR